MRAIVCILVNIANWHCFRLKGLIWIIRIYLIELKVSCALHLIHIGLSKFTLKFCFYACIIVQVWLILLVYILHIAVKVRGAIGAAGDTSFFILVIFNAEDLILIICNIGTPFFLTNFMLLSLRILLNRCKRSKFTIFRLCMLIKCLQILWLVILILHFGLVHFSSCIWKNLFLQSVNYKLICTLINLILKLLNILNASQILKIISSIR